MTSRRILMIFVAGLLGMGVFLSVQGGATQVSEAGPAAVPAQVPGGSAIAGTAIPGQYIVIFRSDVDSTSYSSALERLYGLIRTHVFTQVFQGFAGFIPSSVVNIIRADPNVLLVEQDTVVTADVQTIPTGITRSRFDQNATAAINGSGADLDVDVAVIDTGVDSSHSELRVAGGFAKYATQVCTNGWFGSQTCSNQCGAGTALTSSLHWHGTHVAGIIGARDNTSSVVGGAPGARIWNVRVLGSDGNGCVSDVIAGVDWVASQAGTIEVANMSLSGGSSSAMCTAINNAINVGIVFAVAAGNNSDNAANYAPSNCTNAITVAAITDYNGQAGGGAGVTCGSFGADDSLASFSNYGSVVDIAAPGSCILSTYPGNTTATASGTSMASPYVAAAAALDILVNGKPTNSAGVQNVRNRLVNNGFAQNSDCGYSTSNGLTVPLLNMGSPCVQDQTPPANPTGLTAAPGNTQVVLDWNNNGEGDLGGYNVYRSTSNGGPYSKVNGALLTSSAFTNTGLTNNQIYYFVVRAVDTSGNESGNSNQASATPVAPPNTPPANPTGLTALGGNNQVVLDWNNNNDGDLAGYNVYRSTTNGSGYAKINGATVGSSAYTDTTATNGTTYYYVVRALDTGNLESGNSNQASATPAAPPPNTAPVAPTGLVATAGNGQVALDWANNSEGDLAGYNVYRSTSNGGPYTKVNGSVLTSSAFTNTGLSNGTTYYYVVTAIDTGNLESGNSAQVSATPSAPPATCSWWQRLFGQC